MCVSVCSLYGCGDRWVMNRWRAFTGRELCGRKSYMWIRMLVGVVFTCLCPRLDMECWLGECVGVASLGWPFADNGIDSGV